jgi:hypothetical protein
MKNSNRAQLRAKGFAVVEIGGLLAIAALMMAMALPRYAHVASTAGGPASEALDRNLLFGGSQYIEWLAVPAAYAPQPLALCSLVKLPGAACDASSYGLLSPYVASVAKESRVVSSPRSRASAPQPAVNAKQDTRAPDPKAAPGDISQTDAAADAKAAPAAPLKALTPEDVRATIFKYMGRVKFCYANNPQADGAVIVRFLVHPNGSVTQVSAVASSIHDEVIENCLVRRVSVMQFPAFEGDAKQVKFPFRYVQ